MARPTDQHNGPPVNVIERLVETHERTGTLDKIADSGIGDSVEEQLATQMGYMRGYTEAFGTEPWSWDGTTLTMLADVNEGPDSSNPRAFVEFNGDLYFSAFTEETGYEIFKLSGGESGEAVLVADINDEQLGSDPVHLTANVGFTEFNEKLYFTAFAEDSGYEIYTIDGSGDVELAFNINNDETLGSAPMGFTEFEGNLYFSALSLTHGRELYMVNGESGALDRVTDLHDGQSWSSPSEFTVFNGNMYFRAYSDQSGPKLYKVEGGTGSVLLVDEDVRHPSQFTVLDDVLYFVARAPGSSGTSIHKLDLASDTVENLTLRASQLIAFDGDLYFTNLSDITFPITDTPLYKLDVQTNAMTQVTTAEGSTINMASNFATHDGDLYFEASTSDTGRELFKVDAGSGDVTTFDFEEGPTGFGTFPIGSVNGKLAVVQRVDEDGDGFQDGFVMFSASGEPNTVADFEAVEDSSGTFQPRDFLYVTDGDLLM